MQYTRIHVFSPQEWLSRMTKGDDAEAQVKVCGETVACGSKEAWKHERSRYRTAECLSRGLRPSNKRYYVDRESSSTVK